MTTETLEFSREIATEKIGDAGRTMSIEATPEERDRLANRFGLVSIERLSAEIILTPEKGGKLIRLKGTFSALITQNCVVNLEPFESTIEETLERVFDPTLMEEETPGESPEGDFEFKHQDPPEPAGDGIIDVGEAVAEQLALEIDPFPRKPGVSSGNFTTDPEAAVALSTENAKTGKNGPFAALEDLKKKLK